MTVTPTYARPVEGELRVGHVFSRAWDIFAANFVKFVIITAIVSVPNLLLLLSMPIEPTVLGPPAPGPGFGGRIALGTLLAVILNLVAQAVILYIAFQFLRGQTASFGDAVQKGLARFFPILGCVVLLSLGIGVGFLLFIVPGLILMVRWSVAVPACVLEGTGPVASLGRSAALTKGHRWKIFGILMLMWIGSLVVSSVLGLISRQAGLMANVLTNFVWTAVWAAYFNSILVMLYHDLRVAKEGVDVDQIAAVFD